MYWSISTILIIICQNSFIFDIIFLTPVVGLMMSGMYKKIQMMSYLNPEGLDLNITLLVSAVFIFLYPCQKSPPTN